MMKNNDKTKITIGCDPEFFLWDTKEGEYVSAHDKVPGNKKEPHRLQHGAVQADGTAVEFNIDPASTPEEFAHNIAEVMYQIRMMIPSRYAFVHEPLIEYKKSVFDAIPDEAKELGCDPDFDGLTRKNNVVPKSIGRKRTSSGHIHVGWTKDADCTQGSPHFLDASVLAVQMYNSFYEQQYYWDPNYASRLFFYGSGAAMRPKPYGMEFRHLSGAWMKYPQMWGSLFKATRDIFQKTEEGTRICYDSLRLLQSVYNCRPN